MSSEGGIPLPSSTLYRDFVLYLCYVWFGMVGIWVALMYWC